MNHRKLMFGIALAVTAGLGFGVGSLRAAGAPQTDPLFYSGTLTENGDPVTGVRNVRVSLWKHETSTAVSNRTCETVANNAPVEGGRFRVALDSGCAAAVHAEAEQWVELEVGGISIGPRAKLGAVPYALAASRAAIAETASAAAGALGDRIAALEARASVKGAVIGANGSESAEWISSVTHANVGTYQIAFAAGTFATAPACVATAAVGNSKSPAFECFNLSTAGTECRANIHDPDVAALGIAVDSAFSILCVAPN